MSRVYADTNFLTRLYLPRPETADAVEAVKKNRPIFPLTWILRCETINAFELSVFLGRTTGQARLTPEQVAVGQISFSQDIAAGNFDVVELPVQALCEQFESVARRHTARRGFRSYDIIHIVSAVMLKCHAFWSFDLKARELAAVEGLKLNIISD